MDTREKTLQKRSEVHPTKNVVSPRTQCNLQPEGDLNQIMLPTVLQDIVGYHLPLEDAVLYYLAEGTLTAERLMSRVRCEPRWQFPPHEGEDEWEAPSIFFYLPVDQAISCAQKMCLERPWIGWKKEMRMIEKKTRKYSWLGLSCGAKPRLEMLTQLIHYHKDNDVARVLKEAILFDPYSKRESSSPCLIPSEAFEEAIIRGDVNPVRMLVEAGAPFCGWAKLCIKLERWSIFDYLVSKRSKQLTSERVAPGAARISHVQPWFSLDEELEAAASGKGNLEAVRHILRAGGYGHLYHSIIRWIVESRDKECILHLARKGDEIFLKAHRMALGLGLKDIASLLKEEYNKYWKEVSERR